MKKVKKVRQEKKKGRLVVIRLPSTPWILSVMIVLMKLFLTSKAR